MLGYGWHLNLQKPMCSELGEAETDAGGRPSERPSPAGDGELPLLSAAAEAERDRGVRGARHCERLPHEDGGERTWWLGSARAPASNGSSNRCAGAGESWCSTTAGTSSRRHCGSSVRCERCGPGWGEPRSCERSRSTRQRPSSGNTRTASAASGTSPWLRTCISDPTTTRTTSGGRSRATAGYSRVNRCTGRGIQQPSLETYVDGEMRTYHALDDDWGSSFRDSGRHWLRWLRTGEGPLLWSAEEAVDVLRFALAVYASSAAGGAGIDPASIKAG